jgi:hypothetical protein
VKSSLLSPPGRVKRLLWALEWVLWHNHFGGSYRPCQMHCGCTCQGTPCCHFEFVQWRTVYHNNVFGKMGVWHCGHCGAETNRD